MESPRRHHVPLGPGFLLLVGCRLAFVCLFVSFSLSNLPFYTRLNFTLIQCNDKVLQLLLYLTNDRSIRFFIVVHIFL